MKMPAMPASAVRKLRNAAYVLLLAVAVVLVVIWWPVLARIWRQQALTFAGAVIVMICGTFVQARNFLVFLDAEHSVRLLRFTPVWALSALANYVAPLQPGIAVRVGWLARRGVNVSEGLLATWRQLVVSVWISMIGLAVGLLLTGDPRGRWAALVLGVVWVAVFALRKLGLRALDRLARPHWLARRKELLRRAATNITPRGIAGVVVQYLLGTLLLYWIYLRFGASIGWGQALIICCLAYMSSLVAFLPGNLGVVEAIYMLGGHGFGLSIAEAGGLAILIRIAHVVANMLLVLAGSVSRKA
ncbi:MAG TPA: lysylphosphatidylglycerol synthase domain-containing protein [Rhodanobacter sp.]|jgi:uncharacterized membrane protein YbhN (UPF0104 family)|nr:lysylphosphatidylglycerol synthase domain-containing protein [Rhodanobacter sp.]